MSFEIIKTGWPTLALKSMRKQRYGKGNYQKSGCLWLKDEKNTPRMKSSQFDFHGHFGYKNSDDIEKYSDDIILILRNFECYSYFLERYASFQ